MKKKFKDTKVGKIFGSIVRGVVGDTLSPVVGGVSGAIIGLSEAFKSVKKDNLESVNGGQGKIDWIRLASLVSTVVLLVLFLTDKISLEKLNAVVDILKDIV